MKGFTLENDKIAGKCLDTEINFCLNVEQQFAESHFEQPIGLRFVYGKISITLFFCLKRGWTHSMQVPSVQLQRNVLAKKCANLVGVQIIRFNKKEQWLVILIIA